MWQKVGIVRNEQTLKAAVADLEAIAARPLNTAAGHVSAKLQHKLS